MPCCGCCAPSPVECFHSWLFDSDRIQTAAVYLIYVQIGSALIGSIGVLYGGVHLANLAVCLFALIAVESRSQYLGRTYAVLLFCMVLLDIIWFVLFSMTIWTLPLKNYGAILVYSSRLSLLMQIIGSSSRAFSSLLWIWIYRLGVSMMDDSDIREADHHVRERLINPTIDEDNRQNSFYDDLGSIVPGHTSHNNYNSTYEDVHKDGKQVIDGNGEYMPGVEALRHDALANYYLQDGSGSSNTVN